MATNDDDFFGLGDFSDPYMSAVSHAVIDAAGSIAGGGSRPQAVPALCDVVASLGAQHIDIRSARQRRLFAEACAKRIVDRMKMVVEALDKHGADSPGDLLAGDAPKH